MYSKVRSIVRIIRTPAKQDFDNVDANWNVALSELSNIHSLI